MAIVINKVSFLDAPISVESLHGVTFSSESKGHQFVVSCMHGGQMETLTGSVTAKFMRANNTTILIAGNDYTGIVDGKAVVTLPQDCYNVPGRFQLAIFNTSGGATNCIYACIGSVQRTQHGELIDSGDAVPSLEELLAQIDACEQATADATAAANAVPGLVAETFSESKAYSAGAYVYYSGNLYRFTADHAAGAWTGSDATVVKLGNDVADLKSALNDFLHKGQNLFSHKSSLKGYTYISGNLTADSKWEAMTDYIPFDSTIKIKASAADTTGNAVEIVRYSTSKTYIDTVFLSDQNDYTATRTGVGYLRIAVNQTVYSDIESVVVMVGDSVISGEPYGKNLVLDDGGYLNFAEIVSDNKLEQSEAEISAEIPKKYVELSANYLTYGAYVRSGSNPIFTIFSNPSFAYYKIQAVKGDKFRCTFEADQNTAICAFGVSNENDVPMLKVNDGTPYYINHIFEMPIDGYFYVSVKTLTNKTNPFRIEKYVSYTDAIKCVSCVGDSLTQGNQDGSSVTYPGVLQSLLTDYIVKPHGCGGDNAIEIAAMTDGYTLCVNPFTIPGDTSEAVCTLSIPEFEIDQSDIARQNDSQLRFCKVGNVYGSFKWNGNNSYKFYRIDGGNEPVILDRPTAVRTTRSFEKDYTTVIWAGTNNPPTVDSVNELIEKIDTIINQLTHTRYVVIGLTPKSISGVETINQILGKKYGKHFLDIRKYILSYGLEDVNITPTEQDLADMAEGQIPTSLRTDNVHLNQYGYTIVGTQVYTKGKSLGYW